MRESRKYNIPTILSDLKNGKNILSKNLREDIINNVGSLESILSIPNNERIVDYLGDIFGYMLKSGISDITLLERANVLEIDERLRYFTNGQHNEHEYIEQ